jgi:hypothetical protein
MQSIEQIDCKNNPVLLKLYKPKIIDVIPFTYSDYCEILDMYDIESNDELSILLDKLGFNCNKPITHLITKSNSITSIEIMQFNNEKNITIPTYPSNKKMELDEFNEFMLATFTHSCIVDFIIKVNVVDSNKYTQTEKTVIIEVIENNDKISIETDKYIKARRIFTKSKRLETIEFADFINIDNKWHYVNGKTIKMINNNTEKNIELKNCIKTIRNYYLQPQYDDDENDVFKYGHYEIL